MKINLYENIPYGSHERHVFDLMVPEQPIAEQGIVFYIHGGGWIQCSKNDHRYDLAQWAEHGYIAAAMNYRYASETTDIGDILDDVTAALKATAQKCRELGFAVTKSMLLGGSAGGHLCMLYAFTRYREAAIPPVAICQSNGPTDLSGDGLMIGNEGQYEDWKYHVLTYCCGLPVRKDNIDTEAVRAALARYSPIHFAENNPLPTAFSHGTADDIVPFEQSVAMQEKLAALGVETAFTVYENAGHDISADKEKTAQSNEIGLRFAEKYLK